VMYIRLHAFKDAMRNEIARLLDELNDPAYQLPEAETDE